MDTTLDIRGHCNAICKEGIYSLQMPDSPAKVINDVRAVPHPPKKVPSLAHVVDDDHLRSTICERWMKCKGERGDSEMNKCRLGREVKRVVESHEKGQPTSLHFIPVRTYGK